MFVVSLQLQINIEDVCFTMLHCMILGKNNWFFFYQNIDILLEMLELLLLYEVVIWFAPKFILGYKNCNKSSSLHISSYNIFSSD